MKAGDICARAAELVGGDREKTHGSKLDNHIKIARMWNAYLHNKLGVDPGITPLDVANLMETLKIARRQSGTHNDDDYVDGAGYAGVAGEIASEGGQ